MSSPSETSGGLTPKPRKLSAVSSRIAEAIDRVAGDSSRPVLGSARPFFHPAGAETAIDPRLTSATILPAAFKPVGKLPNYFGVVVSRIPEMPGVLRYNRDRIVDLTIP